MKTVSLDSRSPGIFFLLEPLVPQRVVLIRHAATEQAAAAPQDRPLSPARDAPLSPDGRRQASLLAERVVASEHGTFLSSPLRRATETAQIVTEASNGGFEIDPRLREIDFGDWEGLSFEEMACQDPERITSWCRFARDFAFPAGERLGDFLDRIEVLARRVAGLEGPVILISHGGVIRTLICLLLSLDPRHALAFGVDYASISQVDLFSEGGVLVRLNDTCHLDGQ